MHTNLKSQTACIPIGTRESVVFKNVQLVLDLVKSHCQSITAYSTTTLSVCMIEPYVLIVINKDDAGTFCVFECTIQLICSVDDDFNHFYN